MDLTALRYSVKYSGFTIGRPQMSAHIVWKEENICEYKYSHASFSLKKSFKLETTKGLFCLLCFSFHFSKFIKEPQSIKLNIWSLLF